MKPSFIIILCGLLFGQPSRLQAQGVPAILNYQGRLAADQVAFNGVGQFKFSVVDIDGSNSYWNNSPDANGDGEPDSAVLVAISRGIFSILLGDTNITHMSELPLRVFTNQAIFLRVWFSDGATSFERLIPDQRVAAVGYAIMAATVPDGSITAEKLAHGVLSITNLSGTLAPEQIPNFDASKIASGRFSSEFLPTNVVYRDLELLNVSNILADRILQVIERIESLPHGTQSYPSGLTLMSAQPNDPAMLTNGFEQALTSPAPPWITSEAEDAPSPRFAHAAVWAQNLGELFVWGGQLGASTYSKGGAIYQPEADRWEPITGVGAPSARRGHSMVYDGTHEVIVWGGFNETGFANSGARFDSITASWRPIATLGAPSPRDGHCAVWVSPWMMIWGGRNGTGPKADGALYSNVNNEWTPLPLTGAPPPRSGATAVWADDRVLIWGGLGAEREVNSGGQLLFSSSPEISASGWAVISTINAPVARTGHAAVWTGFKMIIWGGRGNGAFLNDGAIYDPVTDIWTPISSVGAPSGRADAAIAWTGQEMLVFAGDTVTGPTQSGAAYNPWKDTWRTLNASGTPVARRGAIGVWTGTELLLFGGESSSSPVSALQRLSPQPTWYFYRRI